MHGLPADFDPSFLIGKRIEVVTFLIYQVELNLSGGIAFRVEGSYSLFKGHELLEHVQDFPIEQSSLPRILEKEVVSVEFNHQPGDIRLNLADGYTLAIDGENGYGEAYTLSDAQRRIVV